MKFDRGWVKRPDSTHQPTDHGQGENRRLVRYWHLADILYAPTNVCFRG